MYIKIAFIACIVLQYWCRCRDKLFGFLVSTHLALTELACCVFFSLLLFSVFRRLSLPQRHVCSIIRVVCSAALPLVSTEEALESSFLPEAVMLGLASFLSAFFVSISQGIVNRDNGSLQKGKLQTLFHLDV